MASVTSAGAIAAASMAMVAALISGLLVYKKCFSLSLRKPQEIFCRDMTVDGLIGAIGNTPLILIKSLSEATGCKILAKAEFLNPGGSVKDRVAVKIIEEALESGDLVKGGIVFEGSAGSTAISLAMVAPAYGCKCHVVIPDDVAIEKLQILESLGATVERVRPVSITHKDHFVNVARRRASEATKFSQGKHDKEAKKTRAIDSLPNGHALVLRFGPKQEKIWTLLWQLLVQGAHLLVSPDSFRFVLLEKKNDIKCFLIDPPGSGLYNKVTRGVMYTREEAEGRRLKNPFDTVTEGIGINRLTKNFMMARLDGAFRGTDMEAVEMSRFLLKNGGLFVGSSSAMNCVGAVRVAQLLGPGHTIVTILCDSGMRHLSKFFNPQYLSDRGLTPSATGLEFLDVR
ncbi:cysteine synthase 2 isoform X3 [Amborella trichopoda]|uniref:cysteine synthase 2 isoform X3 n=1 Tax=Amborella trichopoda TaxID=13333 RepID=UPI0009BC90E4|nr:cysteine synthase 2 isoform X3 [Amborella trichopoda]|eukprot:XP_020530398.1 cysteine synthase 2 isoform X3 [Amborella trichopoda]